MTATGGGSMLGLQVMNAVGVCLVSWNVLHCLAQRATIKPFPGSPGDLKGSSLHLLYINEGLGSGNHQD